MRIPFRYHFLLAAAALVLFRPTTANAQRPMAVQPGWFGRPAGNLDPQNPISVTPGWYGRPTTPSPQRPASFSPPNTCRAFIPI